MTERRNVCVYRVSVRSRDLRTHWAVEASISFGSKEREAGLWDFTEQPADSQVDEKEQTFGK